MSDKQTYTIRIKKSAENELDSLPDKIFHRITAAILKLEDEPRPVSCKKLRGVDEYRLRVGDYRVLYTVDDKKRMVEIMAVGHRKDVYKR